MVKHAFKSKHANIRVVKNLQTRSYGPIANRYYPVTLIHSSLLEGLCLLIFHFASLLGETFVSLHAPRLLLSSCSLSTLPHKRIL